MFVSVAIIFYSFEASEAKVPLGQCSVEFRCCRVISFANQKLTFDERISRITRHDDFSLRSDRVVSLQVARFLRDFTGRSYRRRAGQTENE